MSYFGISAGGISGQHELWQMIMVFVVCPRKIDFVQLQSYHSEHMKPVLSVSIAEGLMMDVFIRTFTTSTGKGCITAIFPSF